MFFRRNVSSTGPTNDRPDISISLSIQSTRMTSDSTSSEISKSQMQGYACQTINFHQFRLQIEIFPSEKTSCLIKGGDTLEGLLVYENNSSPGDAGINYKYC